jgi:hypothetical protein
VRAPLNAALLLLGVVYLTYARIIRAGCARQKCLDCKCGSTFDFRDNYPDHGLGCGDDGKVGWSNYSEHVSFRSSACVCVRSDRNASDEPDRSSSCLSNSSRFFTHASPYLDDHDLSDRRRTFRDRVLPLSIVRKIRNKKTATSAVFCFACYSSEAITAVFEAAVAFCSMAFRSFLSSRNLAFTFSKPLPIFSPSKV